MRAVIDIYITHLQVYVFYYIAKTPLIYCKVCITHIYKLFLFQDVTGVVPLHSKLAVDTLGHSARCDSESRLHITSDSCCYRS